MRILLLRGRESKSVDTINERGHEAQSSDTQHDD